MEKNRVANNTVVISTHGDSYARGFQQGTLLKDEYFATIKSMQDSSFVQTCLHKMGITLKGGKFILSKSVYDQIFPTGAKYRFKACYQELRGMVDGLAGEWHRNLNPDQLYIYNYVLENGNLFDIMMVSKAAIAGFNLYSDWIQAGRFFIVQQVNFHEGASLLKVGLPCHLGCWAGLNIHQLGLVSYSFHNPVLSRVLANQTALAISSDLNVLYDGIIMDTLSTSRLMCQDNKKQRLMSLHDADMPVSASVAGNGIVYRITNGQERIDSFNDIVDKPGDIVHYMSDSQLPSGKSDAFGNVICNHRNILSVLLNGNALYVAQSSYGLAARYPYVQVVLGAAGIDCSVQVYNDYPYLYERAMACKQAQSSLEEVLAIYDSDYLKLALTWQKYYESLYDRALELLEELSGNPDMDKDELLCLYGAVIYKQDGDASTLYGFQKHHNKRLRAFAQGVLNEGRITHINE